MGRSISGLFIARKADSTRVSNMYWRQIASFVRSRRSLAVGCPHEPEVTTVARRADRADRRVGRPALRRPALVPAHRPRPAGGVARWRRRPERCCRDHLRPSAAHAAHPQTGSVGNGGAAGRGLPGQRPDGARRRLPGRTVPREQRGRGLAAAALAGAAGVVGAQPPAPAGGLTAQAGAASRTRLRVSSGVMQVWNWATAPPARLGTPTWAICTSMGPRAVTAAWLASRTGRMPRRDADCVQVPTRARRLVIVDRRFVQTAHRSGLQVPSWTINDEAEMRHLLDLGIDAIMTDRPRLLREVLVGRGQWHGAPVGAG